MLLGTYFDPHAGAVGVVHQDGALRNHLPAGQEWISTDTCVEPEAHCEFLHSCAPVRTVEAVLDTDRRGRIQTGREKEAERAPLIEHPQALGLRWGLLQQRPPQGHH